MLLASYKAEVEYRHHKYLHDTNVEANILHLAQFLTADDAKFGVMMCGVCGNGKTTLLRAFQSILNYIVDNGYYEERKGFPIVDAKDIAQCSHDYKLFESYKKLEMLAVEDIGREAAEVLDYGNVLNPLVDLMEYRYNEQLFTVITTNLTPKEMRSKYGDRIADRFNEMLKVIIFENGSYRK